MTVASAGPPGGADRGGGSLTLRDDDLHALFACPHCDALLRAPDLGSGERAYCSRCGTALAAPREGAFARVVALALAVQVLLVAAVFFPFLELQVGTLHRTSSVLDAVMAFSSGPMVPLSLAVAALIVLVPALRVAAILYTLWPLARGRPPFRHARRAFRLAQALKPWAMAEIFILGVAVALVKVAGVATVTLGPAFWAFAALVVIVVLQDTFMCKWTIWNALDRSRTP